MLSSLIVPPLELPVTIDEARAHCRVDHTEEDELLFRLVEAATAHLEGPAGILGRSLVTQTWRVDVACFSSEFRFPLAPIQSIVSVEYYEPVGSAYTTLDGLNYRLGVDGRGPILELASGSYWPAVATRGDAVRVTYVAGYGSALAVPAALKHAILLLVGHWYNVREAVTIGNITTVPLTVDALVAPYRRWYI